MALDTAAIAPIKHLYSTRGGMLAMTQEAVWLLNGGGADKPLTPTNALADPQTYSGVSDLAPLRVGSGFLYTEGKGYAVRMLEYNEIARVYGGADRSILANHLFGAGKEIIRWGYQESPFKTVWCVRADGVMLAFTIVTEEEVFAWTPCETRGKFTDLVVVREGNADLEGEEVAILGDGNVMPRQTVVDGAVTLPNAVTRAIVGLSYRCRAKTLPLIVPDAGIEGKRKRVVAVSPRLINSRGLKIGDSYDRLYDMKERTTEMWGRPTLLQDGVHHQSIGTTWTEEAFTYFELNDPLPVTLLSLVQDTEVGDESD
jgi:hypothetical protein